METGRRVIELADIDENFLGSILESSGMPGAVVESYTSDVVGTGQMAKCIRFNLKAGSGSYDIPKGLIGKFPSDDVGSRSAAAEHGSYMREVFFYQELDALLDIKVPQCFYADMSDKGEIFSLIMEDMAPAEQGNQLAGCTPDIAEIALQELVGLHAPTWNKHALFEDSPLLSPDQERDALICELYAQCLDAFKEKWGGDLSAEQLAIFDKVAGVGDFFYTDMPVCAVTHGDYRLDNFLLLLDQDDPCLTVIDWQTYRPGNPLNDVAYALATSLTVEERREHEERLVRHYYEGLIEKGVTDFSWDDCWLAYRQGAIYGFMMIVLSVAVAETDRGNAMFMLMADRVSRQALDLKLDELL